MKITLKTNATDSDMVELVTQSGVLIYLIGIVNIEFFDDEMQEKLQKDGEIEVELTEA